MNDNSARNAYRSRSTYHPCARGPFAQVEFLSSWTSRTNRTVNGAACVRQNPQSCTDELRAHAGHVVSHDIRYYSEATPGSFPSRQFRTGSVWTLARLSRHRNLGSLARFVNLAVRTLGRGAECFCEGSRLGNRCYSKQWVFWDLTAVRGK